MAEIKKVCVVGGVAGGMTTAMRLRRLRDDIEIHVFEKAPDISIASCGMPFFIGGDIGDRGKMALVNAAWAKARHNIDVHVLTEVVSVDRQAHRIAVRDVNTGEASEHTYDRLVLATGAMPNTASIEGARQPGVFTLRDLQDMDGVVKAFDELKAARSESDERMRAVVVGASFIGLEVAEALTKRGAATTVLELAPQVMPVLDPEMAVPLAASLEAHGVVIKTGVKPVSIAAGSPMQVQFEEGGMEPADIVILAIGVLPDSRLARDAGLQLGVGGSVVVDDQMRTSDPHIYACGDVVQSKNTVIDAPMVLALAGPAVRQARVAAASIAGFGNERFGGVIGTSVVRAFEVTACCVGASEKLLRRIGRPNVGKLYVFSPNKVEWIGTSTPLLLKLVYDNKTGLILGGQITGREGADKRIDVLAAGIQMGMTVRQLAQLELAYAPQFNAPKDPLNVAGMAACNQMDGLTTFCFADAIPDGAGILDVREEPELKAQGDLPGATHIPCGQLRARLGELEQFKNRPLIVSCKVGLRGNHVMRMLKQNGFKDVRNLSGGIMVYNAFHNPHAYVRFLSTGLF